MTHENAVNISAWFEHIKCSLQIIIRLEIPFFMFVVISHQTKLQIILNNPLIQIRFIYLSLQNWNGFLIFDGVDILIYCCFNWSVTTDQLCVSQFRFRLKRERVTIHYLNRHPPTKFQPGQGIWWLDAAPNRCKRSTTNPLPEGSGQAVANEG